MHNKLRTGAWLLTAAALVPALALTRSVDAQRSGRPAQIDTGPMVVATVNGEKITRAVILDELMANQAAGIAATRPELVEKQRPMADVIGSLVVQRMAANGGKPVTVTRADILTYLFKEKSPILVTSVQRKIQEVAIAQEAKKQGVAVTNAEIKEQLTKSIAIARERFHLEGMSDAEVLKAVGVRSEYLRGIIITQLRLEKMVRKDAETKAGHKFGPADFREASHILLLVRANPMNEVEREKAFEEALTKMKTIAEEIKSGKKTFEQAAMAYSEDGSKVNFGKLGVFPRGKMVPEFEKAAFSQPKGTVGDPVRTQYGWHLIRVDRPGEETTGREREEALQGLLQGRLGAKAQEVVTKAKVTNTVPPPMQPTMMPGGNPNQR